MITNQIVQPLKRIWFGNYRKESLGKGVADFTCKSLAWDRSEDQPLRVEMCMERQGR